MGIMISVPDEFFRSVCGFKLPPEGQYGVGNLFMPRQALWTQKVSFFGGTALQKTWNST